MFHCPTPSVETLREELHELTSDLLVDLLEIELLLCCPVRNAEQTAVQLAAIRRTECFLLQHTEELASVGGFLLEHAQKRTVSA